MLEHEVGGEICRNEMEVDNGALEVRVLTHQVCGKCVKSVICLEILIGLVKNRNMKHSWKMLTNRQRKQL